MNARIDKTLAQLEIEKENFYKLKDKLETATAYTLNIDTKIEQMRELIAWMQETNDEESKIATRLKLMNAMKKIIARVVFHSSSFVTIVFGTGTVRELRAVDVDPKTGEIVIETEGLPKEQADKISKRIERAIAKAEKKLRG